MCLKNTSSACSGMNDVPTHPSATSPVSASDTGESVARYTGIFGQGGEPERIALPSPPGSGRWKISPSYCSFSPLETRRTISITSRMRWMGLRYGTPCQPSTTCGPDAPSPMMKRPPEIACRVIAVMAVLAGVRPTACMMPGAEFIVFVLPARKASGVTAS